MFPYHLCPYITHSSYLEIQYLCAAFPVSIKAKPRLLLIKQSWSEFHLKHWLFKFLKNSKVSEPAPHTCHLWANVTNSLSVKDSMVPAVFAVSDYSVWGLSCHSPYSLIFLTDYLLSALLAFHAQDHLWHKITHSWAFICPRHTVYTPEQSMGVGFLTRKNTVLCYFKFTEMCGNWLYSRSNRRHEILNYATRTTETINYNCLFSTEAKTT